MRIDLPLCSFKPCKYCFDGNCIKASEYERCEYRMLTEISNIISDDYDLDRLKELVKADGEGKCIVLPCKDWLEIVFGEQEVFYGIDMDYKEHPIRELSVDSAERFIWYNGWKSVYLLGHDENGIIWEFEPDDVGESVFLTLEEAEAALEKMKGGE